jgi:hypothetical protein
MIIDQAFAQPEQPLGPKLLAQPCLDLRAAELRIAIGIEQALLGGDEQAGPVGIDGAALQDPVVADRLQARSLCEAQPDRIVAFKSYLPPQPLKRKLAATGPSLPRQMIGPVSRSQISPNISCTTLAQGAAACAALADAGSAATSRTSSPAPSASPPRQNATTALARGLQVLQPQIGMTREIRSRPHL